MGSDDWTTLPEAGGLTSTDVPADCEAGLPARGAPVPAPLPDPRQPLHGDRDHRLLERDDRQLRRLAAGTFDLSAYAGQQVEVSISYVTDPSTGGVGAFVDDTAWSSVARRPESEGFETGLGRLVGPGPPAGSPPRRRRLRRARGAAVRSRHDRGLGAARLRPGADRLAIRASVSAGEGDGAPVRNPAAALTR